MPTNIDIGTPNEKQKLFLQDHHKHVGFGGARGGGKSWSVRAKAVLLAAHYDGIKILILRKSYPELYNNHIKPFKALLHIGQAGNPIKYVDSRKEIIFPTKRDDGDASTITFGYCSNDSDLGRYQGQQTDIMFLDEATQLTEYQIKELLACVRGANNFPKRIYYTCNPGGKGHAYIKRIFIDKQYVEGEYPEDYSFIQSLVYDNVALMETNKDYIKQLEALPEALRKAWLYGDWDSFVGQVFVEWRNDPAHYADRRWTHVIDDIERIPETWHIYRGFDFGYSKPFSVCWFAVDHDGRIYHFKEWYGCTTSPNTGIQLTVQEIAQGILDRERADPRLRGRKIRGIADPAIWESSHGESIAQMLEAQHVYFDKGDHARLAGLMQFHYRLAFDEQGYPMFYCCRECKQFVRTIPILIYDDKNVEDIDTDLEDHIYDATRYVLMEHPINPRKNVKRYLPSDPLPPEDPLEMIKPTRSYT